MESTYNQVYQKLPHMANLPPLLENYSMKSLFLIDELHLATLNIETG